jgi:hypothetical protein
MRWLMGINTLLNENEKITGLSLLNFEQKIKYCGSKKISDSHYNIDFIYQEENEIKIRCSFYLYFDSNNLANQILSLNFEDIIYTYLDQ